MNSTTLAALISGIGGAAFGAWLTGWFTVLVKKRKRVQQRRAEVYVDVLAWIGARMAWLASQQAGLGGPQATESKSPAGLPAREGNGAAPVPAPPVPAPPVPGPPVQEPVRLAGLAGLGQLLTQASARLAVLDVPPQPAVAPAPDAKKRTTCPDSRSMLLEASDPGTEYFISLQARVAVFASHDMARAFDKWVDAYRIVRTEGPEEPRAAALSGLVHHGSAGRKLKDLPSRDHRDRVRLIKRVSVRVSGWVRTKALRQRDFSDGLSGCLTRVVEFCASEELRKG
jgi:hypothetical protein